MFGPVELLFLPQMNNFKPKSRTFAVEYKTNQALPILKKT